MPRSSRIVAVLLGSVFLWAGLSKLLNPSAFINSIGEFGLVWEPLLGAVAWGVIGLELAVGGGLWWCRRWAVGLACALVVVFLCVLGYGILLGLDIECGCFGTGEGVGSLTLKQAAVVDVLLLGASIGLARSRRRRPGEEPNGEEN
jgi:putative oxidoreductase